MIILLILFLPTTNLYWGQKCKITFFEWDLLFDFLLWKFMLVEEQIGRSFQDLKLAV